MAYIEVELSLDDYLKVMNLDEFDIERKILQTSACDYIKICLRPERLNDSTQQGCESLNFCESKRDKSEAVCPPIKEIGHEK